MEKIEARTFDEPLLFEVDGLPQHANRTWFRGEHCNFNPKGANLRSGRAIVDHVLSGWLPAEPPIGPDTRVTTFGSCFAEHIGRWLSDRHFNVLSRDAGSRAHIVRMGEGMVNSFALVEQFRWALEGRRQEGDFWHGYEAESFGYDEDTRRETEALLRSTDIFVLTFGLSEIWYDAETGGVFWRAVPSRIYDPSRHKFRVASFAENKANIREIYDLIRRHVPGARILFTMSPIPLVATFRPVSCITANSASKALLRAALDEVYREVETDGVLHYWPSYEIILDVFDRRWADDRRHVKEPVLDFVMTLFQTVWCRGGAAPPFSLEEAYARALAAVGEIPVKAALAVERRDRELMAAVTATMRRKPDTAGMADHLDGLAALW